MRKLLTVLLDTLFPPTAAAQTVRTASSADQSALYRPDLHREVVFLASYQHPLVRSAVTENKFRYNHEAAALLGDLLRRWHAAHGTPDTRYLPIPLGSERARSRGYNQVLTIIQAAGLEDHTVTTLLHRARDTTPQTQLDRTKRLNNLTGAFICDHDRVARLTASQLVLVDDVMTTGATMQAARAALLPHLPDHTKLRCLAIAH